MTSLEMLQFEQAKGFALLLPYEEKPSDTISVAENKAHGEAYYFTHAKIGWTLQCAEYETNITKPLSPFTYRKPKTGDNPFNPEEEWETKERVGYYPLTLIRKGLRGPNHWHREDDTIVCGIYIEDHWETRYFPKNNIPESTWQEAMKILGKPSK